MFRLQGQERGIMERAFAIVDSHAVVEAVAAYANPDVVGVSLVHFVFTSGEIVVSVNPDTDEIVLSERPNEALLAVPFFDGQRESLLGARLKDVWTMENRQGYSDGMQLEFARDGKTCAILQFIAIGSTLSVYSVNEMDWEGDKVVTI